MRMEYIQGLCQFGLSTADYALFLVAKFRPPLPSVTDFALSNGADIFVIMILYDFCFLHA
jgi:hypothetical protein